MEDPNDSDDEPWEVANIYYFDLLFEYHGIKRMSDLRTM